MSEMTSMPVLADRYHKLRETVFESDDALYDFIAGPLDFARSFGIEIDASVAQKLELYRPEIGAGADDLAAPGIQAAWPAGIAAVSAAVAAVAAVAAATSIAQLVTSLSCVDNDSETLASFSML